MKFTIAPWNHPRLFALALGGLAALPAAAYEQIQPPSKVVLPAARSPAESLAAITVAPELRVELVAAEPLVMDPIDVAWGPDGRMWVVEMADYPNGLDGQGRPGGRIRVLESTRGDGHYDRSTLFADGLTTPTSVMPWRRGVLVIATPDIRYLEDRDGDGRADVSEVLFTGFREGNQQHRVNSLQWGLDGWVHVANGDSGGTVRSIRTGATVELGRRDLRIRPDDGALDAQSGRTQYGRNRDDWGNWFGGNNSNPVWHYALDDGYLRRNRFLAPPNSTLTVSEIPGAAQIYPTSQTIARFNDPFGANRFTSACGTMIYRDELLGPGFAGNVFICEPVHNLVSRQVVRPAGVSFTSRRAPEEQTSEFFASSDNWSRFTSARTGPDGALYIVDMYRLVIEHPEWIPAAWQQQLGDLRAGSDQGRIYRVYPRDVPLRPVPRLDRAEPVALVEALNNPSGTVRDLAHQQLVWRQATSAAAALEQLFGESPRPATRIQALASLDTIGALKPALLARAFRDPHPAIRRHAVRLGDRFAGSQPELLAGIVELVEDPDAAVRQQVAYSLGEWKEPAAGVALARLARTNEDPLILAAAMSSALPHADTMIAQMSGGGANRTLVEIAIATQNMKALADLLTRLSAEREASAAASPFAELAELLEGLRRNNTSLEKLRSGADAPLQQALAGAAALLVRARTVAADPRASLAQRRDAIALLGQDTGAADADFNVLAELLSPRTPVELQLAAVRSMGLMNVPTVPERLLAGWGSYAPEVRATVVDQLVSRLPWTTLLLDRLTAQRSMLAEIDATRRAALLHHSSGRVSARAAELMGSMSSLDRQNVIDRYLSAMQGLTGDAARGRAVFGNACSMCHQLGEAGGRAIGPDLTGLSDYSRPYLVTHILDTNRAVEDKYVLHTAVTNDGRTLAGMLAGEAGNSVTLLGLDGSEQVILRTGLRSLTSTRRSLMPDGLEGAVDPQGMADLLAFIVGSRGSPAGRK